MREALRDRYENWILLCPTCHEIVDGQENTYSIATLHSWKTAIERRVDDALKAALPKVTFVELETTCSGLAATAGSIDADLSAIGIREKIKKNSLSNAVHMKIAMGSAMYRDVSDVIQNMTKIVPDFAGRLKRGFVTRYNELKATTPAGDVLFYSMQDFASAQSTDPTRMMSGLAVLAYFFQVCDIFEK